MWTYEHSVETTAAPEAIWRLWADVENWWTWNADIVAIRIDGPFREGAEIVMTPAGEDPVRLVVADVVAGERFVDEARFEGLVLRTTHRVDAGTGLATRVTYRMEITGAGAGELGPRIGPAVTGDWPETMAALVKLAAA
ncbi:SRPBCC family protein [Actinacidiphila rubida]|uniref:Polyketide cyclase / dehydrase and lipid transport n=1 Tax=Actinacidiphila rubida TaxID=310780 RepID=A0A1H8KIP5_9ACTN|nr:SRPBCC family protein [Actinacidiphila rubida]SEN92735.1 Polyketide cyclase / dehydrase and lipid transport [Actinacidiphila rubida]